MNKTTIIAGTVVLVGIVGVGAYFLIRSTSSDSECTGSWTDNFNPACWVSGVASEFNTILIVVAVVIVAVVALLAFGTSTGHIAGAASKFALL